MAADLPPRDDDKGQSAPSTDPYAAPSSGPAPDNDPKPTKPARKLALDVLRGIAVFLMIEQHVGIWVWRGPDPGMSTGDYPLLVGFNALGGMAAPLFVTLAGMGSALFVAAGRKHTDRTLVTRGLVLMGFGYVLNFLSPSWFSWGSWFVLHMMGFAMAMAPLWRRLNSRTLLGLCGAVLIATIAVRLWLETPNELSNRQMADVVNRGPLRIALAEGQFPILPWLTFYLAGFVSGRFISKERFGSIAALGLVFALVGGGGHLMLKYGIGPTGSPWFVRAFELHLGFFPASVAIVGLLLGGALLIIAAVSKFESKRPINPQNPMVSLGRISLTLLMLHVPLFRDWSRSVGVWHGLSSGWALATVFGFFGLALVAARYWQRVHYRFGAEWALRKLAG